MLFNRTFAEAYTKSSRTKMTMRISSYVSHKRLLFNIKYKDLVDEYDLYNRPIELFGLPDQLPIFSLLCTGDVNNYRLLAYEET